MKHENKYFTRPAPVGGHSIKSIQRACLGVCSCGQQILGATPREVKAFMVTHCNEARAAKELHDRMVAAPEEPHGEKLRKLREGAE